MIKTVFIYNYVEIKAIRKYQVLELCLTEFLILS